MSPNVRKKESPSNRLVQDGWLTSEWARIFAKVEFVGSCVSYLLSGCPAKRSGAEWSEGSEATERNGVCRP